MPKATSETLLIGRHELPGTADAHQFVGAQHGGVPVSLFLVHSPPGARVALHRHPYPEVFVLHAGRATFEVDEIEITAVPGDIVIAPVGAQHQFVNTGGEELRLTAIHTAAEMSTQWLTPPSSETPPLTAASVGAPSRKESGSK
jgi:quercetin dioxygenase-like cupin family protein